MSRLQIVLLIHAASTWAMIGLIWFVQIVHYPLFSRVGEERFPCYEQQHQRRTTWVVALPMLGELITAVWLCFHCSELDWSAGAWWGVGLLTIIWLSTALCQVPAHQALSQSYSVEQHRRLVLTNWARTVAWSARGLLVLVML